MYKFSVPMPYTLDDINRLLDINRHVEKSKITSLYACVPRGCEVFTGFEQSRNFAFENVSWDYWKNLIEHVLKMNCDFIYLLNNPRPLNIDSLDFQKSIERLDILLTDLKKIGVNKLRVASTQLQSYIGKHYKNFNILASTSLEYKTLCEYQNFIAFHKEVKQIVPCHDVNKNFKLLSILRKQYPEIEIELMVNEGCLQGCPNRDLHEMINIDNNKVVNNDICLSGAYCTLYCNKVAQKYPIQSLVIGNLIFPWDIKEYEKIGITNFKLVGREGNCENFKNHIDIFFTYLKGVENYNTISKYPLCYFSYHLFNNSILNQLITDDYKKYLPEIKHFKKYGHLCASRCGVECRYCYKCAEKIQNIFLKKQAEQRKRIMPVCFIK